MRLSIQQTCPKGRAEPGVGIWIAQQADALGLSRWLQAPILVATFMFGPLGLVVFLLWKGAYGARTFLAEGVKP